MILKLLKFFLKLLKFNSAAEGDGYSSIVSISTRFSY